MSGFPVQRRRINPALRHAVRASGRPGWQIATAARFLHHARFSALINARSIPNTVTNIDRLERIADIVGFDKAQLFLDGGR